MPDVIEKYDICIVKNMKLDFNVLSRAKKMKLIMQYGVGLEGHFHISVKLFKLSIWDISCIFVYVLN